MKNTTSLAIAVLLTAFPAWADTSSNQPFIVANPAGMRSDAIATMPKTYALQAQSRQGAPRQSRAPSLAAETRPAGIYLVSEGQLVRLEFNVSGQTRTAGLLGTMMTGGIAHASIRVVLQGETARVRTSERTPIFYFYLPDAVSAANRSSFEAPAESGPTSPNEFSLIRLIVKDGRREARVGRANIGGVQSGVIDRDRIGFRFENPRPGVYSVNTEAPLQPGEYSFVMIGSGGARQARFFDFSVQ